MNYTWEQITHEMLVHIMNQMNQCHDLGLCNFSVTIKELH